MSLEHSPAREAKNGHTGNIGRMLISDVEAAKLLGCNPGGGGYGDATALLRAMLDAAVTNDGLRISGVSRQ